MSLNFNRFNNAKVYSLTVVALAFVFSFASSVFVVQQETGKQTAAESQADSESLILESLKQKYQQRSEEKWEKTIQELESKNAAEGPWPRESLLFYGSSSSSVGHDGR